MRSACTAIWLRFLALFLFAGIASAQAKPLPEAPKPKHADRFWAIESAALGSLYAADFTLTARGLGQPAPGKPGFVNWESDPLFGRHPSDTRIALTAAAQFGLQSCLLQKTEHSRRAWIRWSGRAAWAYFAADEVKCIRSWK